MHTMEHSKIVVLKLTTKFILSNKSISEVDSPGMIIGTLASSVKLPFSLSAPSSSECAFRPQCYLMIQGGC